MNTQQRDEIPELHQKINLFGKVTAYFVDHPSMAYLLMIVMLVTGIMAYSNLPRESMPEVIVPMARITTIYTGASPDDVEALVTEKIEAKISELEDISSVSSTSSLGRSSVAIEFESGVDMDQKGIQISNKMNEINFPTGVNTPTVMVFATSDIPLMRISVMGDYEIPELTGIAEDVQNIVEKIPGVGDAEISGDLERRINIQIDPSRLAAYGLPLSAIQSALSNANVSAPIGDGDLSGSYYSIRLDEGFQSLEEIENLALESTNGDLLLMRDIAKITDGTEEVSEVNQMYIAGEDTPKETLPAVMITVEREEGSDVVGASQEIREALEKAKGAALPADITFNYSGDQAEEVSKDLSDVIGNAVSGLFVVIIVLFLFIGFRESLIVSGIIPLTMLAALVIMEASGITLNSLSLLGLIISLGLLVDNAIVVMENVDRLRHEGLDSVQAAKLGTNQVGPSIFSSSLTTIAAFLPLAMMGGTMGDFIRVIPLTIVFAIVASFLFSIAITPTLCARHLEEKRHASLERVEVRWLSVVLIGALSYFSFSTGKGFSLLPVAATVIFTGAMWFKQFRFKNRRLEESALVRKYEAVMIGIVDSGKKQWVLLGSGMLVFILCLSLLPLGILKTNFMPSSDPTAFTIAIEAPQGSTLAQTTAITAAAEKKLYTVASLKDFSTTIGGATPNSASISLNLKDDDDLDGIAVQQEIRELMRQVGGAEFQVTAQSDGRPGGSGSPVEIKLTGNDTQVLEEAANIYLGVLKQIPGVLEPALGSEAGPPQLMIDVNKNKALSYGLNPSAVATQLRAYISGVTVTQYTEAGEEIDVVLQLEASDITSVEEIGQIHLTTAQGNVVPVSAIADIKEGYGFSEINHDDYETTLSVQADLESGYNLNDVLGAFEEAAAKMEVDDSVSISYGGDRAQMDDSFSKLGRSLMIAAMLVFIILAVQFNSITQTLTVILTLPMAAIGVILGLIITGNDFGFYAFMGMVALVGIAVNDAIVLVDYINYLRSVGHPLKEAVVKAGVSRFLPVFSTSITTIGGILPLALKEPYYGQLGYSLVFGLMVATVMTLVFIPVIYSMAEGRKGKLKGRKVSC